jgi:uncharacterized glyoxalase superfamily protein PhnB
MRTSDEPAATRLVVAVRYRNVPAAIVWLCAALDFREHDVLTAEDGTILRAQLTFGNDMIMLLPVADPSSTQPAEMPRADRQSCYFVVDDADAHYSTAKAAGADIILDIGELEHDGRGYACRDPEGHVWSFGTYDPRQVWPLVLRRASTPTMRAFSAPALLGAMLAAAVATAALVWMALSLLQAGTEKRLATAAIEGTGQTPVTRKDAKANPQGALALAKEQAANDTVDRATEDAFQQLARERAAKESARRLVHDAAKRLTWARNSKETTERAAQDVRADK